MAIDQRDVSSTLRFMDDRALQQYAAMHKNDPYIFPLAFQESQNRQKLRMSQQAQMAQQPQPKVADQALAQMTPQQPRPMAQPMPEDQGIATLPAPNMKFGAEGGIMGYEGYDESGVPNTFGEGPVRMMAEGGVARYQVGGSIESRYQQESQEMGMGIRMQYSPDVQAYALQKRAAENAGQDAYMRKEQERQLAGSPMMNQQTPKANNVGAQRYSSTPYGTGYDLPSNVLPPTVENVFQDKEGMRQVRPKGMSDEAWNKARLAKAGTEQQPTSQGPGDPFAPRYPQSGLPAAAKAKTAPAGNVPPAATGARPDTGRNVSDPSATRKEPAQATPDVMKMFEKALETADKKPNPLEAQLKAINAERVKAAEENVTGLDAIQKQFADIYKGKKDRLSNKEGEIAKMDKQYLGLAAVLAGARMMQTRGSIGQAIGAGIDTGTQQYIAGKDKINAAKDKLSDARDRLEELEAQRGELSARELHKARNEVKTLTVAGMENLVQAAMAERKMNRAEAVDFVKAQLTVSTADKDRASRENIAEIGERGANARSAAQIRATLSTPDKVMFDQAMAKNGNDAFKAFEAVQQAKGEKFNLRTSYADYIKAFAGKDGLTPPMSIEQYAGKMGALLPR